MIHHSRGQPFGGAVPVLDLRLAILCAEGPRLSLLHPANAGESRKKKAKNEAASSGGRPKMGSTAASRGERWDPGTLQLPLRSPHAPARRTGSVLPALPALRCVLLGRWRSDHGAGVAEADQQRAEDHGRISARGSRERCCQRRALRVRAVACAGGEKAGLVWESPVSIVAVGASGGRSQDQGSALTALWLTSCLQPERLRGHPYTRPACARAQWSRAREIDGRLCCIPCKSARP